MYEHLQCSAVSKLSKYLPTAILYNISIWKTAKYAPASSISFQLKMLQFEQINHNELSRESAIRLHHGARKREESIATQPIFTESYLNSVKLLYFFLLRIATRNLERSPYWSPAINLVAPSVLIHRFSNCICQILLFSIRQEDKNHKRLRTIYKHI